MDLDDMQAWQWFAIAGGAVLVLGLIAWFLPVGKLKVPGGVTIALGGLATGLALGVILMGGFGYKVDHAKMPSDMSGPPGPGGPGGGAPKSLSKGGAAPKMNFGGPPAPSSRDQLVSLVTALDTVAERPLTVTLTAEERAALVKELHELTEAPEVKDEVAKAHLEAILKLVEKDRTTLEAVGFRTGPRPKGGFGGLEGQNPNPFKSGPTSERLKSLLARLEKK